MAGQPVDNECSETPEDEPYNGVRWFDKANALEALLVGALRLRFRKRKNDAPEAPTSHPDPED